ncbi:MAG: CDP-glycerol glycerophosphotransferase family protein [Candidatus Sungbacteria bacterium]|nr:CDP-glycerol glycerophosphotransferase family protein [bacterium]MDZ4260265.1 CDP-glycerol glycerophosphotransferase family protein [Candidatus Sungbacteria bacterium]
MKTIFMSLSSQAVFRKLFFLPGNFFDRAHALLEQEKDYRFIILIPERVREKYLPVIGDKLHERILLVPVDVPPRKTILQKVFVFLYSYLVYTGTTRIMATWGTRPDEPPAGGNRYLSPIKIGIARTLGRMRIIKRKVIPFLFMRIFTERPFERFFTKYNPERVFVPHLYGWFDTLLLAEAKRQGVATVGMPAGWDHLDKYFLPLHADTLLVPSEPVGAHAIEFQAYDKKEIHVVGYPHFDFIVNPQFIRSRTDTLAGLRFPDHAKYILYVSGSSYCPDEPDVIETMLTWMDTGKFGSDVYLVIRPYLGGRTKDKTFDEEKFNRFEHHPRVHFYRQDFWGNIEESIEFINIMRHADVMVAVFTTMVLEASVMDRPVVAVAFDGYAKRPWHQSIRRFEDFTHFRDVRKTGAMRTAYSFDELFTILDSSLKDPASKASARQLLRDTLCYKLDGKASERILAAVFNQ